MIDSKLAAQVGIFTALNVAELNSLARVFQHVPDDREPPLTIVGEMTARPIGGKGSQFDEIEFEVLTAFRANGREFMRPAMAKARELLEGQPLSAPGAAISPPEFLSDDDELLEDGVTYLGTQRFKLTVQPQD